MLDKDLTKNFRKRSVKNVEMTDKEAAKKLASAAMDQRLVKSAPKAGSISKVEAKQAVARAISGKKK